MDTILGILLGESYSGIRALADLSVCIKYTNSHQVETVLHYHVFIHNRRKQAKLSYYEQWLLHMHIIMNMS